MAKRVKSKVKLIVISDWKEADKLLRRVGDMQIKICQIQNEAIDDINEIKADLAKTIKPHQERIVQATRSLEAFAVNHTEDFEKQRSRKLNFGLLGWRKSTSISIKKDTTLKLIKEVFTKAKRKPLIIVKESVDKNALAKLTDEQLACIKARRKVKDDFFVEPNIPDAVDYEK